MTSAETLEAFSDEWGGGGGKRGGQAAWALMLEWRRWLMTQVMCHTPSYKRELLHFVHTNIITHTRGVLTLDSEGRLFTTATAQR